MTLLYILRVSFIFISSAFFFSCTCPEDKIREDMKMKESAFLSSNSDCHIVKSSVYIYKVGENTNFLSNDKIQEIASNYALNKGEANRSRQKANMQRISTTFDNDFNPNWSEIARNEDSSTPNVNVLKNAAKLNKYSIICYILNIILYLSGKIEKNEVEQNKNSLGRKGFITEMACGATWKKF